MPWGTDGFSLDVMRRSPQADNGVTEFMVDRPDGRRAASSAIRRVSLNFAVFRSAFEEGARIGAGPILRLWRRLLLVASRWWQIESLFRSNVKYRPEWQPRFLCFDETRDIALVGAASGVAEGFIDLPTLPAPRLTDVRARPRLARPGCSSPASARASGRQRRRRRPGARADPAADGRPRALLAAGDRPVPAVVPADRAMRPSSGWAMTASIGRPGAGASATSAG